MQKFLRTLALVALILLPVTMQAQNARVSEYDGSATTATYSSIAGTTGATAWSATNQAAGYVDVAMPFAMYFGETQVPANSTLRVYDNGSATFESVTGLEESRIAPLYLAAGYTTSATSVYTKSSAQQLTVEWRKVVSGSNSYSFQLKLYSNGDIEFCYGPMTLGGTQSVFSGLMSSSTDVFRARGEGGTLLWNSLERATDYVTRTISSNYYPEQGTVYTFTQPACVKPTGITATATAWNTINVEWTVSSNGNGYEVKYSTDPDFNPATEGTSKTINNGATLTTTITGLTGSTTYYFYVRKNCGTTPSGWNAVKASATTLPGCFSANMPSVTPDGVVTWTSPDDLVTSYDVKYGPVNFDPENEGTAINNIAGLTTTLPVASMASASTYEIYLRAHCSASGLTTDWVGPISYNTPCAAVTISSTNTINEGFEGTACPPVCWTGIAPSSANPLTFATDNYYSGAQSFRFSSYSQADEYDQYLISPELNSTTQMQVAFKYARYGSGDNIRLGYSTTTNDTTAFTWMDWMTGGVSSWDSYTAMVPANTKYIAIHYYGNYSYYVWVDDLAITPPPTCPNPSALAIDDVTGNNVTLSWTENGTATAWQIAYGLFTTNDDYVIVDATTNPFTVSNLGLGEWFFYVRSNCAANDQSEWIGGVSQNFGYCTPSVSNTDGTGLTHVVFGESMIVDNSLTDGKLYQNFSSMIGDGFRGSNLTVNLTYSTGSYPYGCKIWVDWNQDLDFEDDGELVYTGSASFNHEANIAIPGTVALGDYRMRIGGRDGSTSISPCGDNSWQAFQDYTIRVIAAPSCFTPAGLTASNVTSTSATLTWNEVGLSTQWEVKYGPTGFDPLEEGVSMLVSTTPTLALDYLEMGTAYDVYVRAICDPEGPTNWSTGISFTTPNIACLQYGSLGPEETATIGNGTTDLTYVPVYSLYDYSYTQQIYTADEIGGSGVINSIAFEIGAVKPRLVDIYLVETDKSSFASTTDWVAVTDADKVFTGTIGNATGWETYTLTTPFNYSGSGNLVVVVNNINGSWSSGFKVKGASGYTNMSLYKYRDGTIFDPANLPSGTMYSSRANLQLGIQHAQCVLTPCYPPQVSVALSETEYAATLTFTSNNPDVTDPTYGMIWGSQGFNPATAGTAVSSITNGTYTLSNLESQTTYDVYVYAVCGSNNGDTVRYSFTTPFIPNCKTPVIDGEYGASNIAYNTATLTWRQPGDTPMFWTVRYADVDFDPATAAATDYTEMTVTSASANLTGLVAGTTYYVYIKATCATSPVLDESPWLQMSNANPAYTFTTPTCVNPTAVSASDVTNSTAMIHWTEAGDATAWTVKYGLAGFDPDMEGSEVTSTADSIELTGLDPYVNYDVYVKSNCTATDESDWSNPTTFRTVCPDGGSATIGDGTGTTTGVPVANYGSTYCQQIFTAEELREAGVANNIAGLAFNWQAIDASYDKYFTIWLANTDKSSFASTSDFVPYSELTKVYGPVFIEHGTGAGEQEYVFNNAFQWDGNSNIVVVTLMNAGASDGNASRRAYTHSTGSEYRSMYQRKDGSQYTEEQLATITGSSRSTNRANITFIAPCNTSVTCFAPATVTTTITPANVVTVNWAPRTDLRPVVNNYELKYGMEGFNPETQGVLVPGLNNVNTYIINADLAANTNYDVYVRTVCDADNGDYSNWTKASFTTYPTCWIPVNLTVTATTTNSATLSWANDSLAPTAATRWEVCYGPEGFGNPEYYGTKVETTNNTALVVNGLNHSTKYEFYVRAICSATDKSEWSTVATGTTQCGVWSMDDLPLTENFDGYTGNTGTALSNHVMPNCWSWINGGSSYAGLPSIYNSSTYAVSGTNTLRFYRYNSTSASYVDQYAILPEFGFGLDTLVVSFSARMTNVNAKFYLGTMTDPTDSTTFHEITAITAPNTSHNVYEISLADYNINPSDRYLAFVQRKSTGSYYVYMDDLTVKLREKVNTLPDNGGTIVACNEFVMPDTTNGGSYHGNLNATYVVRPAQAGYVARIQGDYDLENGYDFLNVYRGAVNANNLVGRYTGTGSIDYMTTSNLWADSGYVTLVLTTDDDNAFDNTGFKFLVSCEQPMASEDTIQDVIVENGSYIWTAGNGQTYTNHSTMEAAPDLTEDIVFPVVNVAGFDSVYRHLDLTVHPTYELNYAATICERDEYEFYGQTYTTAGVKTVTLQSIYGADSVGILNLTVNSAPTAFIQYNNRTVTSVADMCDNFDMTLNARSNVEGVTFLWEDSSTSAIRVVNPHESNTYSVVAINPATGCTSVPATVNVTTTPVPALTISGDSAICYGQSATLTLADANNVPATYRWSNNSTATSITVNPTTTTTYSVTATSTTGACVATAEFTVTVNALPVVEASASPAVICQNDSIYLYATPVDGYSYSWNNGADNYVAFAVAAATGNYTVTVTDQNGCVNEFTTNNVTVNPVYELNDEQSACVGMLPYTWGTQTLTEAGSYDQTFQTINSCDSTVHLTFIVQDTANNNSYRELCEGASFTFGSGIYQQAYTATESTVISYVDTTSGECPARYNLNLTVNTHNPATVENTVCDTYTWPLTNETYTVSGAYQTTLQTTKGCDSVVTLNLTVNYQNTGIDEQTACDSYEWIDGNIYTASNNTATYTLNNEFGCDSVVTLNLTVNYRSYHEDFHRVCDAKTFTWDDNEVYDLDVELADSIQYVTGENNDGCLEIALLHLDLNYVNDTVRPNVTACDEYVIDTVACDNSVATAYLRESGVYTLRVHNDSLNRDEIMILNLTINESSHHTTIATECLPYTWTILDANNEPFEVATITEEMVNGASVYHTSVDLAEAGYVSTGCSTIEVLRLTPKYPTEEVTEATICQNGTWNNGTVSYNGADLNVGLNTMTWNTSTNADGCQHLDKVALTVNPIVDTTVNLTYCENQFIDGIFNYIEGNDTLPLTIDIAGLNETVYTNTLVADWSTADGCARTVTVNYKVNPVTTEVENVQALTEYKWDENSRLYEGIGTHVDTVVASNVYGCTLYKVLNLEITDSIRHYDTINVCTSYDVNGVTYYEDNTFVETDDNNEVFYTTYHVLQRTFNDVNVVTNAPYTWINGETYTANVSNVYYSVPAAVQGECDDVYRLNLTMVDPIVVCEGQLPYETAYGFTIDSAASDVYNNINNDTIIAYTVKLNVASSLSETACDSYEWNNTTYTESGVYTDTTAAANGCDSIVTLNLTVNNSTESFDTIAACDSYAWHDSTYTASTTATFDTVNANGCDSVATLVLTINKNNGIEETVVACDSYEWNDQTLTASNDYSVTFQDANDCSGNSVLHLTINNTVVANADSIVNEASFIYKGVLYNAPLDIVINDTLTAGAANGCDSITMMHLQLNKGNLIQIDTVYCGDFTWVVEDSVIATYTWIPMAERTNPVFNYKNMATNQPVDDFPVYETYDANGIVVSTYVLHLTMAEASTQYKEVTVLLSNDTYTDPADTSNHVFDFAAEKAAGQNATKLDTLHYSGSIYCDSIVYYTFNLVYNYVDDDTVTVCNTVDSYTTQNGTVVALAEGINVFTDTTDAGTADEMVHNMVYVRSAAITGTETITACDSVTWNNTLFTTNVVDSLVTLAAANNCDSVVTLNITITPTVHNVVTPADVCDSYTWTAGNGDTYTADTVALWSRANATDAQCTDVDTLKLVVKHSTTGTDTQIACDTYTWIDNNTYTESNTTATKTLTNAAGCDSVVTLNLTVNHSFTGAGDDIDTIAASITLTDKNGSYIFIAPYDDDTTLVYQTVAGCDSTVTFHITVNQFEIVAENPIECGMYTWENAGHGTGHTYMWISDAEKSANAINIPGASPMLPLYKDVTANVYVYSRPMDTVGSQVYMLNLNLNEAEFIDSTIARFPQSVETLTLHGETFDFTGMTNSTKLTADTTVYVTLPHATLCGTIMTYNVHVVYNYTTDAQTVCYTDTYTWEDNTTSPVTVGSGNVITKTLFADNWDSLQVVTRTITVRANNNTYEFNQEVCDSYTWNDSVYTTTGAYTQTFTDQYGCDSVATLNLTVKYNTNNAETIAACDSIQWNGTWYTAAGDYTYEYTAGNGCASVDTLHLTINHNVPQVITESVCDSYTWTLNSREYTASGVYTATRTDANTCNAVDTLQLTVRKSTSYDSVMFVTDGSYRYTAQDNTTTLIMAGQVRTFAEHYTNAEQCDSTLNIEIHVGEGHFAAEDEVSCNSYTWRDGNTYVWISAEERAANGNALYKNQTTGAYVMSNPIYNVPNVGDYDSIYMLRLNLTQNYTEDVTINFPISLGTLTYGDSTFNFETTNEEGREFVNTTVEREVHFASAYYCDSIHYLTINLQNNYNEVTADNADICVTQTSYTWRNHTLNTTTNDFDHAHTYYMYDTVGTAEAPVVEYIKVTQHPVVYATERRTACDSYTWNGMEFTESTSNATFDTVDMWGCDSTVTLMLTINHNSNMVTTTEACESYQWKANNAAQTVIDTYTESGDYTYDYISDEGCPSTDELHLTINHATDSVLTVTACDTYVWSGETFTKSIDTTITGLTNVKGCDSTATLHLTILNNSNVGTIIAACDSYVWHDSTYTVSGDYLYEYTAENECASVDTLHLTINVNNGFAETLTVCDSIDWNGHKYYESGEYTVHYADANGCEADSVLTLTVNNATHNSETVVACDSYTWHGTAYTTSGVQTYNYNNGSCASVDTLHLTINHSDYDGVNYATMTVSDYCGDYTWVVNDSVVGVYTESVETSTRFTSTLTGCDSIIFLNLTIKNAPVVDTTATVCENTLPYEWRGIVMNAAGVETVAFPLENGCDSTIRFTLNVNPKFETLLNAEVCLGTGYKGNGFDIAADELPEIGDYTFSQNLTSEFGCDSTVILTVKVKNLFATTVEKIACDNFTWDLNGMTYTESGNYDHTIPAENSCDSVITLALTINKATTGVDVQTACNRYTWIDGQTYTASTNTATFTLENAAGCDSVVTLDLTVNYSNNYEFEDVACDSYTWNGATYNQSGNYTYAGTNVDGCDSVVTLHLTINNSIAANIEATACDSYDWNGVTYTESGNYTYTTTAANNCDSVVTLALTVNKSNSETIAMSACGSYEWNGVTYDESGVYNFNTTNAAGCDSTATLTLTINEANTGVDVQTACDSYTWIDGVTYTESNNEATFTLTNAAGCDSVVTLNLTVNASSQTNLVQAACGSYEWNGDTLTTTGIYTYTTTNAAGCDSTVTLSLVINQSVSTTETATACDSYEWNGVTYTESGVYTFNSTTDEGCESIATLLLTIKNSTNNVETVASCDSYTWNNTEYVQSGDYTYSYTNAAGCASTDTLHLTINASTEETVNATACDSYTWSTGNGQTYTTSGTYTYNTTNANNCAHVVTLALTINNASTSTENVAVCGSYTWNGQTYAQSGVYTYNTTNAAGCDSVATLILSINQPYATTVNQTACDSYEWNGQTYTTSGNYTYNYTASNNCDSAVTLVLTINQSKTNSFNANVCAGGEYTWNNQSYTTAGQYEQTLTARNGCDSVVTMNLTVVQPMNTTESDTACVSYTWSNGQTYTQSGTYTANITDVNGCAATATLNLIVNQPINTVETVANCVSYEWNGQTYTESGTYTSSITDANGCAATATLNLTINPATSEVLTVAACDSYTWVVNDSVIGVYTETPGYQLATPTINENGCPHTVYLLLTINNSVTVDTAMTVIGSYTWHGETYSESGTYTYTSTGSNGCDSTTILNLTVQPATTYYTVTLTSANPGMGTVSDGGEVAENTLFTAVATANDGYHFVAWIDGNGDTVSELETYQFVVTSDVNLTAHFAFTPIFYNVTAQVVTVMQNGDTVIGEHAQVLGAGEFESGSTVTLTAVADSGYHFVCWSNGRNTATITFTVTDNIELIAYFEQDQQTPPQAIDETDMSDVVIFSVDTRIIVRGVEGNDVYVFDVNGRMLDHKLDVNGEVEFRVATTGVYLVKVGNAPAKRVLVVR